MRLSLAKCDEKCPHNEIIGHAVSADKRIVQGRKSSAQPEGDPGTAFDWQYS
jgi:hypothetical protein